jgi:hypothetical protein
MCFRFRDFGDLASVDCAFSLGSDRRLKNVVMSIKSNLARGPNLTSLIHVQISSSLARIPWPVFFVLLTSYIL